MRSARLLLRVLRALWRSGLLRLGARQWLDLARSLWRCGVSYAALASLAAARFGARVALQDEQGALTFAELFACAEALAGRLYTKEGLRAGGQTALLAGNDRTFVVGLLALSRLGADVLLLNPESPEALLAQILARRPVQLVLHDPDLGSKLPSGAARAPVELFEAHPHARLPRVRRPGQLVLQTSGSTGAPKDVRRRPTLASVLPTAAALLEALPVCLHAPVLLAIPLFHGYGLGALAMALAAGAPLQIARRLDVGLLIDRPREEGGVLVTVPTLLGRWMRQSPARPRLAAILCGSEPLPPALCTEVLERCGPILFNFYGSTEAGLMALAPPALLLEAPGCVGLPSAGVGLRLVDEGGRSVPAGGLGRILVRGPFVLQAGPEGWYDTGDRGRFDEAGRLFVCGRSDNMFVSGGENVYPEETEALLAAHPSLEDAAVTVVPDSEFGQRMIGWVVLRAGVPFDEAAIRAWLSSRLERFKLPRRLHAVPAIPRNAVGKIDRGALRTLSPAESSEAPERLAANQRGRT
ncbi:MAG: AMP-binding protein [Myxococcales bacterium]